MGRTVFYVGGFEAIGGIEAFLFDLLTDVIQLCDGALVQNMAEVVNVVGRAQLRDRLSVEQELQRVSADRRSGPHAENILRDVGAVAASAHGGAR